MARGVTDRDMGYRKIMANLRMMGRISPEVLVGVRGDAGESDDGTSLVLIAAVNEFGSADGHVPERSFLRSTIDEKKEKYLKLLTKATGDTIDKGRSAMRTALGRVGAIAVADVQRKIVTLRDPPNAPSTIAKKGSANPLVDTGRLGQSIDFEVKGV